MGTLDVSPSFLTGMVEALGASLCWGTALQSAPTIFLTNKARPKLYYQDLIHVYCSKTLSRSGCMHAIADLSLHTCRARVLGSYGALHNLCTHMSLYWYRKATTPRPSSDIASFLHRQCTQIKMYTFGNRKRSFGAAMVSASPNVSSRRQSTSKQRLQANQSHHVVQNHLLRDDAVRRDASTLIIPSRRCLLPCTSITIAKPSQKITPYHYHSILAPKPSICTPCIVAAIPRSCVSKPLHPCANPQPCFTLRTPSRGPRPPTAFQLQFFPLPI